MVETKEVEVRDKVYIIKRWTFDDSIVIDTFADAHADNLKEQQAFVVLNGVLSPKFETIDAVKQEDHETITRLWYEIQQFNTYDANFLSLLRNSSRLVVQPDGTRAP